MGNSSSAADRVNKKISMRLGKAKAVEESKLKLLLLGAGESGKSTIFKQMKLLYGQGYTHEERFKMRPTLIANIITGALEILKASDTMRIPLKGRAAQAKKTLEQKGESSEFDDESVSAILTLWKDPVFRSIWEKRSQFQLQETWHLLVSSLENYPEWGGPEWCPTTEEILLCRVRTSGIVDELFVVKNIKLRMIDVGGQRSERRKWIQCFEGVTSVLFVSSLNEYDQQLFEAAEVNRLVESLELFTSVVNSEWFTESAIILFLNKTDLFEEKFLQDKVPLNASGKFPDAPSGFDLQVAYDWFQQKFKACCENPNRQIYVNFTCATDTQGIDKIMKNTSQHVLQLNLRRNGVLA